MMLDAHLRRTEDMPGGMQRHADAINFNHLTVGYGLNLRVRIHARPQHSLACARGQIGARATAGMVGMRVRDDGALNWLPRIDEEIACRAVQAVICELEQSVHNSIFMGK
jgi:hypothetical protein